MYGRDHHHHKYVIFFTSFFSLLNHYLQTMGTTTMTTNDTQPPPLACKRDAAFKFGTAAVSQPCHHHTPTPPGGMGPNVHHPSCFKCRRVIFHYLCHEYFGSSSWLLRACLVNSDKLLILSYCFAVSCKLLISGIPVWLVSQLLSDYRSYPRDW